MDDFKTIGRDLWEDKPLLIAVVVAVIGVIYILWKNQNNVAAPTLPSTPAPAQAIGTYVEESYYNYAPTTTSTTTTTTGTPIATPIPSGPLYPLLTIRAASTADIQRKIKGIPIRAATSASGKTIGGVNFGQKIQAIGALITGGFNNPLSGGSGSNQWYPVSVGGKTGYISAYDVANAS